MTNSDRPISEKSDIPDSHSPFPEASTPAHVTSLIWYIALAFTGACLIWISASFDRPSAAYAWSNRVGVFLLLGLNGYLRCVRPLGDINEAAHRHESERPLACGPHHGRSSRAPR